MDDSRKTQEELINELTILRQQVAEAEQSANELGFHSEILQNMSEGIHLTRVSDGLFVFANPTFEQMLGYEAGELIDKHISIINAPTDQDPVKTVTEITQILNETGTWQSERQNIKKDGTTFWCHVTVTSFHHAEFGDIWISVHQDITLRKQAEATLQGKSENLVDLEKIPQQDLHYLIHELQTHQIELEMQNSELRRAQHQIEEARDRFVDLYDFAPVGYITVSDRGIILDANLTFTSMLGIERSKLFRRPFSHFVAREDQDTYYRYFRQASETDGLLSCTVQLVRQDNSRFYALLEGNVNDVEQRNPKQYRLTVSDNTKLKQAEIALQQRNLELETLLDIAQDIVFILETDGTIRDYRASTASDLYMKPQEFLNKRAQDIFPPEIGKLWEDTFNQLIQTGAKQTLEYQLKIPTLTISQWYEAVLSSNQQQIILMIRNITERKHTEISFQKSEHKYSTLVGESPYCIHEINLDRQLISMNPAGLVMMDVDSEEDIIGTPYLDAVALDSQKHINDLLTASFSGSDVFFEFKGVGETPHLFSSNFIPIKDSHGNVQKVMGITQDITERKQAEEALSRQNTILQTLIDALPDYIFVKDRKGRFIVSNAAHTVASSVSSQDDIIGKTANDVFPIAVAEQFHTDDDEVMSLNQTHIGMERRTVDSSGNEIWVSTTKVPLLDDANTVTGLVGISRDITEHKQIERYLEEQHNLLRQIIDMNPNVIMIKDMDGKLILVNEAYCATVGKSMNEVIGESDSELLPNPAEAEHFIRDDQEVIRTLKTKFIPEEPVTYADGELHWHQTLKIPFINHDARPSVLIVATNITAHKQAEEALRKSNRAYKLLSDCNQMLIRTTDETVLLNEICRLIVEVGEYRLAWIGFAEHDDAKTVRPVAQEGYEEGYLDTLKLTWDDTERGRGPAGTAIRNNKPSSVRNILTDPNFEPWRADAIQRGFAAVVALPISIEDEVIGSLNIYAEQMGAFGTSELELLVELAGDLAYGIYTIRTRAAHKQAEEALAKERNLLNTILDNLPVEVYVKDRESRFVFINASTMRTEKVKTPKDFIGKTDFDLMFRNLEVAETFFAIEQQVMETGEPNLNLEYTELDVYGKQVWLLISKFPLRDAQGNITGLVGINIDITNIKQAEEALAKERNLLSTILDNLPLDIYVKDRESRFVFMNAATMRTRNMTTPEDYIGKTDFDTLSHALEDAERFFATEQQIIKTGEPILNQEYTGLGQEGTQIWLLISKLPLRDAQGNITSLVGINMDITDIKYAEQAIIDSEQRLKAYANALPDRTIIFDRDGNYQEVLKDNFANRSTILIADVEGKSIHDVMAQDFADYLVGAIHQSIDTDTIQTIEYTSPHDSSIHMEARVAPFSDPQTGEKRVIWLVRDITERKQIELALQESEKRYRHAEEIANIGGWERDFINDLVIWSPGAYRIYGVDSSNTDLTHEKILNLIHPSDRDHVTQVMNTSRVTKEQIDVEYRIVHSDQIIRIVRSVGEVRLNQAGEVIGLLGAMQDITKRKQAETLSLENEHLKTQFQKEQEQTTLIGRIISTLSHDMRTPLSVIAMSRDILSRYFDQLSEEKRQEKLDTISHQIQFALQLLDDTVQMARGRHEFHPEIVNLASLCQISIDEVHLTDDSTHRLSFNNIGNIETATIDETLVSRILLNLLSNAIKYSPNGGEIRLELDTQDDWIILSVTDHGIGIDSADLPHIFDLLYRAGNVEDILGTGLGLSIVKDCVERHQGSITVQSDLKKGSTFTIKFPR